MMPWGGALGRPWLEKPQWLKSVNCLKDLQKVTEKSISIDLLHRESHIYCQILQMFVGDIYILCV